ncbi:MAG: M4 family metallopeptidase [Bacteroidetes bacterium]|nr:M4 family metallopeptidase [Bacteroidota bacterium]
MKKILLLPVFIILVTLVSNAQESNKVIEGKKGMYPSFVSFAKSSSPAFTKGRLSLTDLNARVTSSVTAKIISQDKDATGSEHLRYQQTINGLPVEHAEYIVHTMGGRVFAQNGRWIKDIPQNLPAATLTESSALTAALQFVHARSYKWQDAGEEAFIKKEQNNPNATFYPKGQLVFYSGEDDVIPSALRPAYKFDIYASDPVSRQIVFVDAVNGQILGKRELLHTTAATGIAATAYSGIQTIATDYTGSTYRLQENTRGNGIQTFNLQKKTNYSTAIDFTDADNNWNNINANKDQYATDAHWGAEMTYDFYKNKFGRNSIDNAGFAIKSYVHYSTSYFNAFWDGSRMTYGDGSSTDNNLPLTALDVCGHEISHGLTSFTSNLTYSNEPGAMNEGFSDIFGTAIEFYARPASADWLIGGDFYIIRSMSNPNAYGQPDTYKGTFWYAGTSDYGGVHTNSGVLNFWFYLLSAGGTGVNDNGFSYNVAGIGIDAAAAIAFKTNTAYLTSTAQYLDARVASIQAATDIYGAGSNEVIQTTNAWDAVGVGATVTPPPTCTDNFESNNTRSTAAALPLNTDNTATISSSTDKDWFKFTTTASAPKLKVTLTNLPADYDVRLYNSNGTQLAASQNAGTTSETITRNATNAATYYLQVYGYNKANSTSCYTLRVSTSGTNFFSGDNTGGIVAGFKPDLEQVNSFAVYPNPVKNKLTVYINAENSSLTELSMIDITGRTLLKQPVQINKGINTISVNVPTLPSGTYIVKIHGLQTTKVQVAQ